MPIGHILRRLRGWRIAVHLLTGSRVGFGTGQKRYCLCCRRERAVHRPHALVKAVAPINAETAGARAVDKAIERVAASGAANPRLKTGGCEKGRSEQSEKHA